MQAHCGVAGLLNPLHPVTRKELLETSRRRGTYFSRTMVILALALPLVFAGWFPSGPGGMTYSELALFGRSLFDAIVYVFAPISLLYAIGTASDMVSGEVTRRTLPVLLLTHISASGAVWGKWKACMAQVGMLLLAVLPGYSLPVYLGGVDPPKAAISAALTAVTAGLGGAISLFFSSFSRSGGRAIGTSLAAVFLVYGLLPTLIWQVLDRLVGIKADDFSAVCACLHPLFAMLAIAHPEITGGKVDLAWLSSAGVTLLVTALLNAATSRRLRRLAAEEPTVRDRPADRGGVSRVWESAPLLWKELHTRPSKRAIAMRWAMVGGTVAIVLWGILTDSLRDWTFVMIFFFSIYLLLAGASAGAASFAKEREEGKWDLLYVTPLRESAVVEAKVVGAARQTLPIWLAWWILFFARLCSRGGGGTTASAAFPAALGLAWFTYLLAGCFFSISADRVRKAFIRVVLLEVAVLVALPFFLFLLRTKEDWLGYFHFAYYLEFLFSARWDFLAPLGGYAILHLVANLILWRALLRRYRTVGSLQS